MKKIILSGVLIIALSAGFVFAQMNQGSMMGHYGHGMMNRNWMGMPMMSGMGMSGMMGSSVVATEDGGIVVMSFNKLYKFDKNLKLVKEADIPFDKEHIQQMMQNMRSMRMMWSNQGSGNTNPQK